MDQDGRPQGCCPFNGRYGHQVPVPTVMTGEGPTERRWVRHFAVLRTLWIDEGRGWCSDEFASWTTHEVFPGEAHTRLSVVERRHQVLRNSVEVFMRDLSLTGVDGIIRWQGNYLVNMSILDTCKEIKPLKKFYTTVLWPRLPSSRQRLTGSYDEHHDEDTLEPTFPYVLVSWRLQRCKKDIVHYRRRCFPKTCSFDIQDIRMCIYMIFMHAWACFYLA